MTTGESQTQAQSRIPPIGAEVGNYYLQQLMLRKSWHLSEYIEAALGTAFREVSSQRCFCGRFWRTCQTFSPCQGPCERPSLFRWSHGHAQALSEVQVEMLVSGRLSTVSHMLLRHGNATEAAAKESADILCPQQVLSG